jgi:subtilisin family serine protease
MRFYLDKLLFFALVSAKDVPAKTHEMLRTNDDFERHVGIPSDLQQDQRDLGESLTAPRRNEKMTSYWKPTKRLIVTYRNEKGKHDAIYASNAVYNELDNENAVAIEADDHAAMYLRLDQNIEQVEEDSIWEAQGYLEEYVDRGDRRLQELIPYGISMIQANQLSIGSSPVTVCIVDTGVDITHPDLDADNADGANRFSQVDGSVMNWYDDSRGHGSHAAGIVAARIENNLGIRGVGEIPLFVTRGLNDDGRAYESDIIQAIEQCKLAGAKVVSLSLGGLAATSRTRSLYSRLDEQGILVFAAAGNEGSPLSIFPAALPEVVSVAAVQEDRSYWNSSNYGPYIELSAPGRRVLSTVPPDRYATYSGTSMATPFAAGAAALVWSHFPSCSHKQIRFAMAYTADKKDSTQGCSERYGHGIVQVKAAYDFLLVHSCTAFEWGFSSGNGTCTTVDESFRAFETNVFLPIAAQTTPQTLRPSSNPTHLPTARPTSASINSSPPTRLRTSNPNHKPTGAPIARAAAFPVSEPIPQALPATTSRPTSNPNTTRTPLVDSSSAVSPPRRPNFSKWAKPLHWKRLIQNSIASEP